MSGGEDRSSTFGSLNYKSLLEASQDFRYLISHGYPRKPVLELVGNRYRLTSDQRHLLHRGVFSVVDSESRQRKKIPVSRIKDRDLAVDGYNVVITVEAGLHARPLIHADDGFIRDISGLSGNFKMTATTAQALSLIFGVLKRSKPRRTLFLFDAPISKSGELAENVRIRLIKENLPGDAVAVRVPEDFLIGFPGIVATSDTAIIDHSHTVLDLAGHVLTRNLRSKSILRWRRKRGLLGKG
jgi:hypothetical protein